jgi:hypothetical protein
LEKYTSGLKTETVFLRNVGVHLKSTRNYNTGEKHPLENSIDSEISSSHGGEYAVQSCLLGYTAV